MAMQIGQCCVDQIVTAPPSSGGSGLNEPLIFTNVLTARILWNATRIARFGNAGVFWVEILGTDGKYRQTFVEAVPDSVVNTTYYDFDFGGLSNARITIT